MSNKSVFNITILDQCRYGSAGLQRILLQSKFPWGRVESAETASCLSKAGSHLVKIQLPVNPGEKFSHCLIIRLPQQPVLALLLMIKMADDNEVLNKYARVIILNPFSDHLIINILGKIGVNLPLVFLPSRQGRKALCESILSAFPHQIAACHKRHLLTKNECRALMCLLKEIPAQLQAKMHHVSLKTVYHWRRQAVSKMEAKTLASLIRRFTSHGIS